MTTINTIADLLPLAAPVGILLTSGIAGPTALRLFLRSFARPPHVCRPHHLSDPLRYLSDVEARLDRIGSERRLISAKARREYRQSRKLIAFYRADLAKRNHVDPR